MPTDFTNQPMGGTLQGAPVNVGTSTAQGNLPDLGDPAPKFLFFHHPRAWYVAETEDGPELLPMLSPCAVEPGIGRVDRYGDPAGLIGHKTSRGWTLIPESAANNYTPDGLPGYVRAHQGRRGLVHLSAWSQVRLVAGRASFAPLNEGAKGYHAWLRSLIERGIIAPCDPEIVDLKLNDARDRLGRAAERPGVQQPGSNAARLLAQAEANVAALETIAGQEPAPVKPAPKRKAKEAANG